MKKTMTLMTHVQQLTLPLRKLLGGAMQSLSLFSPTSPSASPLISRRTLRASFCALLLTLTACENAGFGFPGVYKIGIPQGNIITQDMIDQLRPGMTKRQVIFIMGTPLVRDPYHQDRWDYIYSYQPGGGIRGQEKITMFFENDELQQFTGDFTPNPPQEDLVQEDPVQEES